MLVGRDRELALLDALVDDVEGPARFVFLEGEAGIGKTVLLDHLADRADAAELVVLDGRGTELEQESPFGVFVDAFSDYLAANRTLVASRVDPDELTELATIFPPLRAEAADGGRPPGPDERVAAYRAVARLVDVLAERQPLALVLDDLHWGDRGSLELLAYLLRHRPRGPVVVAGAYRPGQVDAAFAGDVADAGVDHLRLGPLDWAAAEQLMEGVASNRLELYSESGGNPFYLQHLVRQVKHGGSSRGDGVELAIRRELAGLDDTSRALAEAAAIVGDPFDLDLVQAVADLDDDDALTALDELAARDLVRSSTVPRQFDFRHPLVRAAVYEGATPGARLKAHRRCEGELARRGAAPSTRAHHVEFAAKHGDEAAVALLAEAAAEVADRAPGSAARWLQHALRLLPHDADPARRVGLLLPLPGLLGAIGELDAARDAMREVVELTGDDDPELRVALIAGCAGLEQATGRHADASRRLDAAVAELEDDASPAGVALLVAVTLAHGYGWDYAGMCEWGQRAAAAASSLDDPALQAAAYAANAMSHAFAGRVETARANRDAAAILVDAMDDTTLSRRLDAIGYLAGAEMYLDLYAEGADHAARGIAVGRATGTSGLAPTLVPCLGTSAWMLGRVEESRIVLEDAVERARVARQTQALSWSLLNLALAQIVAGDIADARASAVEAMQLAQSLDESVLLSWAAQSVGSAAYEAGDFAEGLGVLTDWTGSLGEQYPGAWQIWTAELIVRCMIEADPERAPAAAQEAMEIGDRIGLPMGRSWGRRAVAEVRLAEGDAAGAVELALEAAELADSAQAVIESAQCRWLAGRALVASGDEPAGIALLQQAATVFDGSGAQRWRDQVEQELGRLGARTHRRTKAGGDERGYAALTGRELEVARLVVDRRTNAEIAEALFLSTKTVETHLRNIFRKLDVTSRTEVARAVEAAEAR